MNNGKETGDIQIVTGGSTVYDNFVTGTLIIEDGGRAYRSDVAGGGKLIVESGGVAAGFTVADSDSVSYDFHAEVDGRGENNVHIVSAPESAFNYEITVRQDVLDGCIAFQCKVADGAVQEIADGGEASYTLVREGGLQLVRGGAAPTSPRSRDNLSLNPAPCRTMRSWNARARWGRAFRLHRQQRHRECGRAAETRGRRSTRRHHLGRRAHRGGRRRECPYAGARTRDVRARRTTRSPRMTSRSRC